MSHDNDQALNHKIGEAKSKVDIAKLYYHYKNPESYYKILDIGFVEWNDEVVVIYKNLDNDFTWVRRLEGEDGWLTDVDRQGNDKRRFVPVDE